VRECTLGSRTFKRFANDATLLKRLVRHPRVMPWDKSRARESLDQVSASFILRVKCHPNGVRIHLHELSSGHQLEFRSWEALYHHLEQLLSQPGLR
jgi:hypothetical protein